MNYHCTELKWIFSTYLAVRSLKALERFLERYNAEVDTVCPVKGREVFNIALSDLAFVCGGTYMTIFQVIFSRISL